MFVVWRIYERQKDQEHQRILQTRHLPKNYWEQKTPDGGHKGCGEMGTVEISRRLSRWPMQVILPKRLINSRWKLAFEDYIYSIRLRTSFSDVMKPFSWRTLC